MNRVSYRSNAQPRRPGPSWPQALVMVALMGLVAAAPAHSEETAPVGEEAGSQVPDPAAGLHDTLPAALHELVGEILVRNPELARLRSQAEAAEHRVPQVRALPDPTATLTAFLSTPETRVGPQRAAAAVSQRFPWFGKLKLKEKEALLRAAASRRQVAAKRLQLVTEARRLAWELAYLKAEEEAVREDRETLSYFEELARARYASGVGLGQAVIKLQAEITKDDHRLLQIENRRAALQASLNALRDRAVAAPLPELQLADSPPPVPTMTLDELLAVAGEHRPEIVRLRILAEAAGVDIELAEKEYRPDVTLGLGYTVVGGRDDAAGRTNPPEGNGDDIVALTVGITLPVRRDRLAAGVLQATALESAALDGVRSMLSEIERDLGDLGARLPRTLEQLALFDDLLVIQAEEALRSAETAYASGSVSALDLLDAERVLLEVRIASARALADALVLHARLEGALGVPIESLRSGDPS